MAATKNSRKVFLFLAGCLVGYFFSHTMKFLEEEHQPLPLLKTHKQQQQQRKKFIFAGVMTANKFLDTRAKAVYSTWGKEIPGDIAFFAMSNTSSEHKDLPIVSLQGVDDTYPPQRKSFMMLKYMHDNYINDYEWFFRADDDLYVNTAKLEKFLHKYDSSKDYYIGQNEHGPPKIKALLGDTLYCMGGPGIVFSASVLRQIVPYLEFWLHNMTGCIHEDVEIARLIKYKMKMGCHKNPQMPNLFIHSFSSPENAWTGNLDTSLINNAITLHPFKKPERMYNVHAHLHNEKPPPPPIPTTTTTTTQQQQQQQQHPTLPQQQQNPKRKKFIFAGVMTANKFLDTRAKAVYSTWGKEIPGDIAFFAMSNTSSEHKDLPIVSLQSVDDTYPPQRKSFMMLKYMHDNYINDYEWFFRADDDLYVNTAKLETFLHKYDSSKDYYIGQNEHGPPKIKALLGDTLYCMGGPGIVFSASVLRQIVPYLEFWLHNMTGCIHEDVEIARLIKYKMKMGCHKDFSLGSVFIHSFSTPENAWTGNLDTSLINNAITLHPFKKPERMFDVHAHLKKKQLPPPPPTTTTTTTKTPTPTTTTKTTTKQKQQQQQQQQKSTLPQQQQTAKRKKFIFAGVMTANKFLDTRAKAVYSTWGKEIPGDIAFFAMSNTSSEHKELPIVSLQGVDDTYPPQRKSFMMLKYMHDNYINDYEWFFRADDDLYVNTAKLETFLHKYDSSKDYYIGQNEHGPPKINALLNGTLYCMGGPGIVFSASVLRQIVPYLEFWLHNMTGCIHEDVEIARLIKYKMKMGCHKNPQMPSLFIHSFSSPENAWTGNLDTGQINNAITLHPFKKPERMFDVHAHLKKLELKKAEAKLKKDKPVT